MMPFPFFIPRDPAYETAAPAVSGKKTSGILCVPYKTSQQVIESNLYFGLDLDDLNSHKTEKKI